MTYGSSADTLRRPFPSFGFFLVDLISSQFLLLPIAMRIVNCSELRLIWVDLTWTVLWFGSGSLSIALSQVFFFPIIKFNLYCLVQIA